jgi:hypothetical protein
MVQLALVNIRLSTVVNTIVLVNQFVPVLQGYVFLERPKGGYSGVSLRSGGTVDILAEQAAGEVLLHVTDTGEGISQKDLDKVFDPFFTRAPLARRLDLRGEPERKGEHLHGEAAVAGGDRGEKR